MNYLKHLLLLLLFIGSTAFAQNEKELTILKADASWGKEIIKFPVEWAPGMTLNGFEELRFAPGWADVNSAQFWTYVLAWKVNTTTPLSVNDIENNLEAYFNGLMKPNHWATHFPEPLLHLIPKTISEENSTYYGKMKYFDGFHKGAMMTNNTKVVQHFSKEKEETIVVFQFSPKAYDHPVWADLNSVVLLPE